MLDITIHIMRRDGDVGFDMTQTGVPKTELHREFHDTYGDLNSLRRDVVKTLDYLDAQEDEYLRRIAQSGAYNAPAAARIIAEREQQNVTT